MRFRYKLTALAAVAALALSACATGSHPPVNTAATTPAASAPAQTEAANPAPAAADCGNAPFLSAPSGVLNINGRKGVKLYGKDCLSLGADVWAFDEGDDGKLYRDDVTSQVSGPIFVASGKNDAWNWTDKPVGSPGDVDEPYKIVLVTEATDGAQACYNSLSNLKPNRDGDYVIGTESALPGFGCKVVARVNVISTWR